MRRRKDRLLDIGSVSSGTLREDDLIPCFLSLAEDLRLNREDRRRVTAIHKASKVAGYYDGNGDGENEADPSEDCSTLFDVLDRYTPDYTYFGAHPGDGADYGVWIVEDLLMDTRQGSYDGDVYRSEMTPHEMRQAASYGHANGIQYTSAAREALNREYFNIRRQYSHWLHVNDHGNATLYRRAGNRWIEVWAIV